MATEVTRPNSQPTGGDRPPAPSAWSPLRNPAVRGLWVAPVAAAGSGAVFLLNAASFVAVIVAVSRWRRPHAASVYPAERLAGAVRAGWRYARHAEPLRAVLVRTAAFIVCGSAVWALLPVVG